MLDVQPGIIETGMTAPSIASYARRMKDGLTLFPRVGNSEEVGRIISTPATGQLPNMTGQVISADGGLMVRKFCYGWIMVCSWCTHENQASRQFGPHA